MLNIKSCLLCGCVFGESNYSYKQDFSCRSKKHENILFIYSFHEALKGHVDNEYIKIFNLNSKSFIKYDISFKAIEMLDQNIKDFALDYKHPLMDLFLKAFNRIKILETFS